MILLSNSSSASTQLWDQVTNHYSLWAHLALTIAQRSQNYLKFPSDFTESKPVFKHVVFNPKKEAKQTLSLKGKGGPLAETKVLLTCSSYQPARAASPVIKESGFTIKSSIKVSLRREAGEENT